MSLISCSGLQCNKIEVIYYIGLSSNKAIYQPGPISSKMFYIISENIIQVSQSFLKYEKIKLKIFIFSVSPIHGIGIRYTRSKSDPELAITNNKYQKADCFQVDQDGYQVGFKNC